MGKDWKALRDELAANDEAYFNRLSEEDTPFFKGEPEKSSIRNYVTEAQLADYVESRGHAIVRSGILTKEMVSRYSDFFDRNGLETDLDKIITEREASFDEPDDDKERKAMCREYRRSIGEQLKAMREKRGYSLREVEERTGISKNIISRTEGGRANTTIDTLAVLSDFYRIDIEVSKYADLTRIEKA